MTTNSSQGRPQRTEQHDESWGAYRPIRRTNLACLNCRRKKVRCSSERPVCHNCQRLSQECKYPEEIRYARPDIQGHNNEALEDRLQNIESQLSNLNSKLDLLIKQPISPHSNLAGASGQTPMIPSPIRRESFRSPSALTSRTVNVDTEGRVAEPISFAGLIPVPVLWSVIDDYFHYCHNQPYSFFHEQSFRYRASNGLVPDHLLFAIMASAVRFSTNPFFEQKTKEAAMSYSDKSWKSIVSSCFSSNETADITTVQTITLLAIFDFTAGHTRHGFAWVKMGLSIRMAQDLRLMMEPDQSLSPVNQEERRRAFWSLYLADRVISCGRARPPAILEASCQLQLPCDEAAWREGRLQKTETMDQLSNKALLNKNNLGPFALVVIMAYIMTRAAQYMLQQYNIRCGDPPWDPTSDFASISSDLVYVEGHFELEKPTKQVFADYLNGNGIYEDSSISLVVYSRALFYLSSALLNHPFLLRHRLENSLTRASSAFLARSFDQGRLSAKKLTHHIRDAQSAGNYVNASFYGYCATVSGAIHALHVYSDDETVRNEALDCVQLNLAILEELGKFWPNVSVMSDALSRFSSNSFRFRQLILPDPSLPPLSHGDQEIMWSLVDYNTMSSAVEATQVYDDPITSAFDASLQPWLDLFYCDGLDPGPEHTIASHIGLGPAIEMPINDSSDVSMSDAGLSSRRGLH